MDLIVFLLILGIFLVFAASLIHSLLIESKLLHYHGEFLGLLKNRKCRVHGQIDAEIVYAGKNGFVYFAEVLRSDGIREKIDLQYLLVLKNNYYVNLHKLMQDYALDRHYGRLTKAELLI